MNKSEFAKLIAGKIDLSANKTEEILNTIFASVTELLAKGDELSIAGFGSFVVKTRAARKGINPRTKESINIPARKAPHFKAGKGLKDAVNK